jgi:hypothetical protein
VVDPLIKKQDREKSHRRIFILIAIGVKYNVKITFLLKEEMLKGFLKRLLYVIKLNIIPQKK